MQVTEAQSIDIVHNKTITINKTQKKQKKRSDLEKNKLWSILDQDKKPPVAILRDVKKEQEIPYTDTCPNCQHLLQFGEDGFPACIQATCGYMAKYSLDYSPEWRYFASDQKNGGSDTTRCGNPIDPLLEESSYACKIMCNSKSSYEMRNLRKWTRWQSMPHKEKALYEEFQIITTLSQNAGIPKVFIDHAKAVYKDLYDQKTFRGVKRDAIRAASIWIVCWKNECPRTSNEIADIFRIDKNSASLGCSLAEELLRSHERNFEDRDKSQLCALTPSAFIARFCSKLNMPPELTILATFVAAQVEKQNLIPDNRPQAIAAGISYFISYHCGLNYSKMNVKTMLGDEVSEVTINKCFKKLEDLKNVLLPSWVENKYKPVVELKGKKKTTTANKNK
jgi:transcription initiation factor TFIIB|tara:strand:+ start:1994 stop:3172 length:1179 start_codon:yes stop_codon:yes gene_type:complete